MSPRPDVVFPRRSAQPGAGPTEPDVFEAFDEACKLAIIAYRRRQWYAGDRALASAARKVARAHGEPFDLVAIRLSRLPVELVLVATCALGLAVTLAWALVTSGALR